MAKNINHYLDRWFNLKKNLLVKTNLLKKQLTLRPK